MQALRGNRTDHCETAFHDAKTDSYEKCLCVHYFVAQLDFRSGLFQETGQGPRYGYNGDRRNVRGKFSRDLFDPGDVLRRGKSLYARQRQSAGASSASAATVDCR
jgi:hypothetical protein